MRAARVLGLAGGTVAFVAVAPHAWRRRGKQHRVDRVRASRAAVAGPVLLPIYAYGITRLSIDMPDLPSIFLRFWDIGNLIWDQISSIVLNILEEAWRLLGEVIDAAFHLVDETFERVWGAFDWVIPTLTDMSRAMGNLIVDTWDGVEQAFANFRQQLTGWLENGYNVIADYVRRLLPDWIESILGDAWDFLEELMAFGIDGIRLAIRLVTDLGPRGLEILLDLVRDPIGFVWSLISGLVHDAIDEALGGLGELWDALMKIKDLILWLADHADELGPDAFAEVFGIGGGSFIDRIVKAFDDNADVLESRIAGWLG